MYYFTLRSRKSVIHSKQIIRGIVYCTAFMAIMLFCPLVFADDPVVADDSHQVDLQVIESLLPADTGFVIKLSGIDNLIARCKTLGLVKLWNDPEVKDFFVEALKLIPEELDESELLKFPLKEIWKLIRGEVTVAGSFDPQFLIDGTPPKIAIALNIGVGNESFIKDLDSIIEPLVWAKGLKIAKTEHRDISITTISKDQNPLSLSFAKIKNQIVASFSMVHLQAIIDLSYDASASLKDDPIFIRCMEKMAGKDHDLLAFIKIKPMAKMISAIYPVDIEGLLAPAGLCQAEAICLSSAVRRGASQDILFLDCPGEKTGMMSSFASEPVSLGAIHRTSTDALLFLGCSADPQVFLTGLQDLLAVANSDMSENVTFFLDSFKMQSEIDIKQDILPSLGKEMTFSLSMPKSGGFIPDIYLTFSLEDEEKYLAFQSKLFTFLRGFSEVVQSSFSEQIMYHINIAEADVPYSPTMTVFDNCLVIASTPSAMKRLIRQFKNDKPGLEGSDDFIDAMIGAPEDASMLFFSNLKRGTEMGYNIAAPFIPPLLAQSDLPFDPALLPMTETVVEYIPNHAGFMTVDNAGILLSSFHPIGISTVAAIAASTTEYFITNNYIKSLIERGSTDISRNIDRAIPGLNQSRLQLDEAFRVKQEGRYEDAINRITVWIEDNRGYGQNTISALRMRGDCRLKLEMYDEAVKDFTLISVMDENSRGMTYFAIARAYALSGNADRTIEYIKKAVVEGYRIFDIHQDFENLKEDEQFVDVMDLVVTVSLFVMESEYQEAANFITNWLLENPYHELAGWALKSRGDCWMKLDQTLDAVCDYEKAAKKDTSFKPSVYYDLACIYSKMKQNEESIGFLKLAIDSGFIDFDLIENDEDLASIRSDIRFKALQWRL